MKNFVGLELLTALTSTLGGGDRLAWLPGHFIAEDKKLTGT
jgi:hypothetical protein